MTILVSPFCDEASVAVVVMGRSAMAASFMSDCFRHAAGAVAPATLLLISLLGRLAMSNERTIPISEVRQRFERVKADYPEPETAEFRRKVDECLAAIEKQYGAEVPMSAMIKAISALKSALPDSATKTDTPPHAAASAASPKGPPRGIRIERTPAGFVLRVSSGMVGYTVAFLVLAGILAVLPFRLGAEINSETLQGGQGAAWAVWAAALLVLIGAAVFAWFSQIRITKTSDRGEIFSGVGPLGRTHRFEWSDFSDVRDHEFAEYTGTRWRTTRTAHDVQLSGPSASYLFGKDLDDASRAFVVAFLREQALGRHDAPGTGRVIAMDRVQESLEQARRYYRGPDAQRFASAIDELSTSLRSQFGDRVPADEIARRLDKLAADTGMRIRVDY